MCLTRRPECAFRRRAAAGRDRPGPGARASRDPVRRAVLESRLAASRRLARAGDRPSSPLRHDPGPRHARPGRSLVDGRSRGRSRPGPDAPVRNAAGHLRAPGRSFRRDVRRHPAHEHPALPDRARWRLHQGDSARRRDRALVDAGCRFAAAGLGGHDPALRPGRAARGHHGARGKRSHRVARRPSRR